MLAGIARTATVINILSSAADNLSTLNIEQFSNQDSRRGRDGRRKAEGQDTWGLRHQEKEGVGIEGLGSKLTSQSGKNLALCDMSLKGEGEG